MSQMFSIKATNCGTAQGLGFLRLNSGRGAGSSLA
jgi:hypothetical protein